MITASPVYTSPAPYWWEDHRNLAELFDWLRRDDCPEECATLDVDDQAAVSYFLNKPWKWTPEYERMRISKTPTAPPPPEDMPSCRR